MTEKDKGFVKRLTDEDPEQPSSEPRIWKKQATDLPESMEDLEKFAHKPTVSKIISEQLDELDLKVALDDDFYESLNSALSDRNVMEDLLAQNTIEKLEVLSCEARKDFLRAKRKLLLLDKVVEQAHELLELKSL